MKREILPLCLCLALAAAGGAASAQAAPVAAPSARPAPAGPSAGPVPCAELVDRGRDFDGREILFEGEAIGDPMRRGDHAWVNILDSSGALGAWLPSELLGRITRYGSYRGKGDVLLVRGVFHRACPDHGGDMDIHVEAILAVTPGQPAAHPASPTLGLLAALSLVAAAALYSFWRRRERR